MSKILDDKALIYTWKKVKTLMGGKVDKELKTGSSSDYKVLSDNNLTDELVRKIKRAGDGSFTGNYGDLFDVPKEFAPAPHTHVTNDVTGLDNRLERITNDIAAAAERANTAIDKADAAVAFERIDCLTDSRFTWHITVSSGVCCVLHYGKMIHMQMSIYLPSNLEFKANTNKDIVTFPSELIPKIFNGIDSGMLFGGGFSPKTPIIGRINPSSGKLSVIHNEDYTVSSFTGLLLNMTWTTEKVS